MPYVLFHFEVNGHPAVDSDTDPYRAISLDAVVIDDAEHTLASAAWEISPPVLPRSRKGKPYPGFPSGRVVHELQAFQESHRAPLLCWWGPYNAILFRLLCRDARLTPVELKDVETPLGILPQGDLAMAYRNRQLISRGKAIGGRGRPPSTDVDLVYRAMGGTNDAAGPLTKKSFIYWRMVEGKVADEQLLKGSAQEDES